MLQRSAPYREVGALFIFDLHIVRGYDAQKAVGPWAACPRSAWRQLGRRHCSDNHNNTRVALMAARRGLQGDPGDMHKFFANL